MQLNILSEHNISRFERIFLDEAKKFHLDFETVSRLLKEEPDQWMSVLFCYDNQHVLKDLILKAVDLILVGL